MLLVSGRVSVPKPLSQIQRGTRWLLQGLSPRTSFGGFGLRKSPWQVAWAAGLHARIALWTVGLLLASSLLLVVIINAASFYVMPRIIEGVLSPVEDEPAESGSTSVAAPDVRWVAAPPPALGEQVVGSALRRLWTTSMITLMVVVLLFGGFGSYWLARRSLRPVDELSQLVRSVSASTLTTRVPVPRPNDQIKDLAIAFNTMLSRLENAFEQQRHFVDDAAHELRNPLSALRTNVGVVRSSPTADVDEYQRVFNSFDRTLMRLETLVENLLVLAREERLYEPEEVLLGPMMEDVRLDIEPLAIERQVAVSLDGDLDLSVRGDPVLLRQAFSNLLDNSVRYNRSGGRAEVLVHRRGADVAITVTDTGVGIPPHEQERIFERFYRVDQSSRNAGIGLGLSIVSHVASLHGGKIEIESVEGVGSRFSLWLPDAR